MKNKTTYVKVICNIIFTPLFNKFLKVRNNLLCKLDYPFNDNIHSFEDLSPVTVDRSIYIDSLLWALKNKNVKNIAMTGSYGSGKSSILKTFKEKHPEFEYLNISLATFDDFFGENQQLPRPQSTQYEEMNKRIELSILQQMLYVEKSNIIPNSRFKKIKNFKNHSLFIHSLFCLIIVLSYIFLFHNNLITELKSIRYYFFESKNCEFNFKFFEILSVTFLLLGVFYVLKNFVRAITDFKFSKINFKGEVELNREVSDNSILNKNLDEIIYFFERTNYNVVLIEDLDRFNEPEIFTKLREINLLLNLSKQVNRHIVFIYALKDEMFQNGDRTKFFDFILPIIPVVNSSNSFDFLVEKLKSETISKKLLYDISLYINDMRLLKNIINEYKVYYDKLTKETNIQLEANKLLSFIVYKNLFPKDFAMLHKNEGMIYKVFNNDLKAIKFKQTEIEEQLIVDYSAKITNLKELVEDKTINSSIKDLRRLYLLEFLKGLPSESTSFIFDEKTYYLNQAEELIEDEIFDSFRRVESITVTKKIIDRSNWTLSNQLNNINISFAKIEKKVDSLNKYDQRVELILERKKIEIENLKKLIQKSENKINKIKKNNFQESFFGENHKELLNFEIKKSEVLLYFITNGFIAEDYFDYISVFKEGDINTSDKNFILSVRNNNALPVDFKLDKVENLIKHLKDDFQKKEILNIDLIDYFLEKRLEIENDDIIDIFSQFNSQNARTLDFIYVYIRTGKYFESFVREISTYYPNFWSYIEESDYFNNKDKDFIFISLIENVYSEILKYQNENQKLSKFISQRADFLNLINPENKNVEDVLLNLNIKFERPLDVSSNQSLFDFIYKNNLYDLNNDMIEQVIKEQASKNSIVNLKFANYTTIQDSDCPDLIKYVNDEILYYVKNVYLKLETNKNEDEKSVISLLNNPKLEKVDPYDLIENQNIIFSKIDEVKNSHSWTIIFSLNKIKPTWLNIFKYYEEHGFDEVLITIFDNENVYNSLSSDDIKILDFAKEAKDKFIIDLILTDEISNLSYSFLIENIVDSYDNLEIGKIGEEKIKMLVEKGIIALSKENFELLRMESLGKQIPLIILNFEEYIKQRDQEEIDYELKEKEYESLLNSNLSVEDKIKLIYEITEREINENNNLGNLVGEILKERKLNISYIYFINLLRNVKFTDTKIRLCNLYFDLFSKEFAFIEEVLMILNDPFADIIEVGKNKPPINNTDDNLKFIENLKRAKYINSYSVSDEKITKIRKK